MHRGPGGRACQVLAILTGKSTRDAQAISEHCAKAADVPVGVTSQRPSKPSESGRTDCCAVADTNRHRGRKLGVKTGFSGDRTNIAAFSLAMAGALLLAASQPALAASSLRSAPQTRQEPKPGLVRSHKPPRARVVQVGAGTTSKETTGFSGPKTPPKGNRTPPAPSASQCKDFHGAERRACLETVLRGPMTPGARRSAGQLSKRR